jgi:hypothetical protein
MLRLGLLLDDRQETALVGLGKQKLEAALPILELVEQVVAPELPRREPVDRLAIAQMPC